MTLKEIIESNPDVSFLTADGFDKAVIGYEPSSNRLVYDRTKMIDILVKRDKMDYDEAIEYLEYNTFGAYVGVETPIYIEA